MLQGPITNLESDKTGVKVVARLEWLQAKHKQLDAQIEEMQRDPVVCATKVRELKAQKLRVKDEIHRLGGTTS